MIGVPILPRFDSYGIKLLFQRSMGSYCLKLKLPTPVGSKKSIYVYFMAKIQCILSLHLYLDISPHMLHCTHIVDYRQKDLLQPGLGYQELLSSIGFSVQIGR